MPATKYVVVGKKFELQCPNCPAEMSVPIDRAGAAVASSLCGCPIPVPVLQHPEPQHLHRPSLERGERGKLITLLGASAAVILLLGGAALAVGATGGPVSLAVFALNFAAGWLATGALLAPLLFPARVPEWMTGHSQWLGYHWLFVPMACAAFFFAWLTYSP